jgi:hypothetical protein
MLGNMTSLYFPCAGPRTAIAYTTQVSWAITFKFQLILLENLTSLKATNQSQLEANISLKSKPHTVVEKW